MGALGSTEAAIIGAGPYGLSLAAHLSGAGVGTRVFGRPMDSWLRHMPRGMLLKSDPFASNLSDPGDFYTLARFSAERSIAYNEAKPVRLDTFCEYGLAFQNRFVPAAEDRLVKKIERDRDGFGLVFDDGQQAQARRVIVAVGVTPFQYMPEALRSLGGRYATHSFDHHDLSRLAGQRVAVVGGGASAIDLAALLREQGVDVSLISRRSTLKFSSSGPRQGERPSLWSQIRHPPSGLGPGLRSRFSTDAPLVFHALPKKLRLEFVHRHLGPSASGVMKEKVVGRVPLLLERHLQGASVEQGAVALTLRRADRSSEVLRFDHVIAGTGFRTDVARLDFLSPSLQRELAVVEGSPVLSTTFESSVPGLYFIGPAAAVSFGPMMRFAFGARYVARRLTHAFAVERRRSKNFRSSATAVAPFRTRA